MVLTDPLTAYIVQEIGVEVRGCDSPPPPLQQLLMWPQLFFSIMQ